MQSLRQLAHRLSLMPPENEVRRKHEKLLLEKVYDMGILSSTSKLSSIEHGATVSAFARRRLPVVSMYRPCPPAFLNSLYESHADKTGSDAPKDGRDHPGCHKDD